MQKRLFIAINLPNRIKEEIQQIIDKLQINIRNKIKFLSPENWHLTITFLGYQPGEALPSLLRSLETITQNYSNTLKNTRIVFGNIVLAPQEKMSRMIWLQGAPETSGALSKIKKELEDQLEKVGINFKREYRPYQAHLTLARFEPGELRTLPNIRFALPSLFFTPVSLDLMESHLKRTGAQYELLHSSLFRTG